MTILSIVVLTLGSWGQRLAGAFALGPVLSRRPVLRRALDLIPAAVVSAVILQLALTRAGAVVLDERLAGMAVAAVLVWRRAPVVAVVVAAATTTAVLRALTG